MTEQHSYRILDALIEQDTCFAIFRLPHEAAPRFVMQISDTPSSFADIEELNGQQGFVVAPFHIGEASPVLLIRPDLNTFPEIGISLGGKRHEKPDSPREASKNKAEYSQLFNQFLKPLVNGELKKLVSRWYLKLWNNLSYQVEQDDEHHFKRHSWRTGHF